MTKSFREGAAEDLKIIKRVFKQRKIEFFLMFGTCLGAVREKNFIQNDQDIDLAVIEKISHSVQREVNEALRREGFKIVYNHNEEKTLSSKTGATRNVLTDIHWLIEEGGSFVLSNLEAQSVIEIPAELLKNFKEASLGDEKYLVPDPPEKYLEKLYRNWKVPGNDGMGLVIKM